MQGLIPKGVSVNLPGVQERLVKIESKVSEVFSRWGFREVGTPAFEYYDEIYTLIDRSLDGALVKLIERETGRIVVLRPDFTPQVARLASTVLKSMPRPLRLYYRGSVFRWLGRPADSSKQMRQIGLELIGLDLPEACAELIGITEEVLQELGIEEHTVVLSNIGFIKALLSLLDENLRNRVANALARKDTKELSHHLEHVSESARTLILKLPGLVGGPDIIPSIKEVVSGTGLEVYLDELEAVVDVLKGYGLLKNIMIDLSEIRGMAYHNGFFFEVFVEGVGRRVAVGGRYDDLMKMYGNDEPAMGFAFNLDELYRAIALKGNLPEETPVDALVVDLSPTKEKGVEVAKLLRGAGYKVARDIIKRELESSIEYAKVHGMRWVVVIGEGSGDIRVMDLNEGMDTSVPKEGLLDLLKGVDGEGGSYRGTVGR